MILELVFSIPGYVRYNHTEASSTRSKCDDELLNKEDGTEGNPILNTKAPY